MCAEEMFCARQPILSPPNYTLDGIIAHDIIRGSVTSEKFVEFLRELVVSLGTAAQLLDQLIVY